ncbi:hypothetical protein C8J57DRAFT_1306090 [Mycena rebaudengoi]|nr:hypothetical protein C8J57DRAFT_1306090 [Mycena rebaudengoi]
MLAHRPVASPGSVGAMLCELFRRCFPRRNRSSRKMVREEKKAGDNLRNSESNGGSSPDSSRPQSSDSSCQLDGTSPEKTAAVPTRDAPHTGRNALKLALTTLSSVSCNLPFGAMLSSIIDPLLIITNRIEQTSANSQGLLELSTRIELLTPVVSGIGNDQSKQNQKFVEALKRELEAITQDLRVAGSQGKLNQFFNSDDNTSALAKHNMTLAQMISDCTFSTVQEVLKSIQDIECSKISQSSPSLVSEGGLGGPGGEAFTGGEGGDGDGPILDIDPSGRWKIGNISGGNGGKGIDVGGKGGTGKAPVISALRNRAV